MTDGCGVDGTAVGASVGHPPQDLTHKSIQEEHIPTLLICSQVASCRTLSHARVGRAVGEGVGVSVPDGAEEGLLDGIDVGVSVGEGVGEQTRIPQLFGHDLFTSSPIDVSRSQSPLDSQKGHLWSKSSSATLQLLLLPSPFTLRRWYTIGTNQKRNIPRRLSPVTAR
jgi:hypothetical protein